MSSDLTTDPIVVSGLAMATAGGAGRGLVGDAPRAGVDGDLDLPPHEAPVAEGGTDRPTVLAATTAGALFETGRLGDCPAPRRALVLGSGLAGLDASMTVTATSLTKRRPYNVSPALVATCVMNYATGQGAIRLDLRGPNVTVTAGRVTGLAALGFARRLLARDRADVVLCGAFEDLTGRRAELERLTGTGPQDGRSAAEGSCTYLVERAAHARQHGRPVLAELAGHAAGTVTSAVDRPAVLARVVRRALEAAAVDPADVAVAVAGPDEAAELRDVLPAACWRHPEDVVGDTHGALAAFRVAAGVLAVEPGRPVVVAATDPDGQVASAVFTAPT